MTVGDFKRELQKVAKKLRARSENSSSVDKARAYRQTAVQLTDIVSAPTDFDKTVEEAWRLVRFTQSRQDRHGDSDRRYHEEAAGLIALEVLRAMAADRKGRVHR